MPVATLAATLINKKWIKEMGDSMSFSLILVAFNMFITVNVVENIVAVFFSILNL